MDPESPPNVAERELAVRLGDFRPAYAWFFQPTSDEDFVARTSCPVCERQLQSYDGGIFPQLLCEDYRLVLR